MPEMLDRQIDIDIWIRDHMALMHLGLKESALLVSPDDDSNNKFI
jgi:hypothetical protein